MKLLNKLGFYTKEQYLEMKFYCIAFESKVKKLASELVACENAKAEAIEENRKLKKELEELKLKLARSVKRRRR